MNDIYILYIYCVYSLNQTEAEDNAATAEGKNSKTEEKVM